MLSKPWSLCGIVIDRRYAVESGADLALATAFDDVTAAFVWSTARAVTTIGAGTGLVTGIIDAVGADIIAVNPGPFTTVTGVFVSDADSIAVTPALVALRPETTFSQLFTAEATLAGVTFDVTANSRWALSVTGTATNPVAGLATVAGTAADGDTTNLTATASASTTTPPASPAVVLNIEDVTSMAISVQ